MNPTTDKRFALCRPSPLALAFVGLIGLATANATADQGRGSIRSAARPAARSQPSRPEPARAEPSRGEPARAEPSRAQPERPQPQRDVRPEPQRGLTASRDWDHGDEDTRHFGGYDRAVPEHIERGQRFRQLPDRHFDISWNNQHYFWDYGDGFYLPQPDGEYIAVQPPVGVIVPELPDGATAIAYGPTTYYYLDGTFYVAAPNGFAVVSPPPGIVIPDLPDGAAQEIINGSVVYQLNGLNFTPTLDGGVTAYTVTPS